MTPLSIVEDLHVLEDGNHRLSATADAELLEHIRRVYDEQTAGTAARNLPVAPNVLAGRFAWDQPNQGWVGDITYLATDEGWPYLAVLLDLFSPRVVGWAMDRRMMRHLPLRALHMAVQRRRPPRGCIHHTDQGSQYASREYRAEVAANGMVSSISAKGRCYDNAVAESGVC